MKTVESDAGHPTSLFAADGGEETRPVPIVSGPACGATTRSLRRAPARDGPVTCVYRAYEDDELVATGRLMLDGIPQSARKSS